MCLYLWNLFDHSSSIFLPSYQHQAKWLLSFCSRPWNQQLICLLKLSYDSMWFEYLFNQQKESFLLHISWCFLVHHKTRLFDVSSLLCHLKLWRCPDSCCFAGPCLDLWPSSNSGLRQCSWPCRHQRQRGHHWCHTDTQQVHGAGPCCSQTAALRSASSIPHLGSYAEPGPRTGKLPLPVSSYNTRESLVLHLTWVVQYSWPWGLRCGYTDPEDRESGRSGTDPHLSIVGELAPKEGEQVSRPLISWALAFGRASQAPR